VCTLWILQVVPEHVNFKLCVPVYRCLRGLGHGYFSEDFILVSEIHSRQRLRSASSTDVVVRGARAWNALPPGVTSAQSFYLLILATHWGGAKLILALNMVSFGAFWMVFCTLQLPVLHVKPEFNRYRRIKAVMVSR